MSAFIFAAVRNASGYCSRGSYPRRSGDHPAAFGRHQMLDPICLGTATRYDGGARLN